LKPNDVDKNEPLFEIKHTKLIRENELQSKNLYSFEKHGNSVSEWLNQTKPLTSQGFWPNN
jgi:hypothetical protein